MLEILPLLIFTTCGGIAAGAYVIWALASLCMPGCALTQGTAADASDPAVVQDQPEVPSADQSETTSDETTKAASKAGRAWLFPLTCIVLLGVGLLGTLMHLGQPLRFINGMSNPASMISQESYWAIAFGILMVVDLLLARAKGSAVVWVRWLAALAACGLMYVTGLAYFDCTFIVMWSDAITLPLFIVGDLAMGAALCMLFASSERERLLHLFNVAFAVAWFAVACSYGVFAGAVGFQVGAIVAGALLGPLAAAVVSVAFIQRKLSVRTAAIAIVVCAVLGVLLVRGAFFAAGVLG